LTASIFEQVRTLASDLFSVPADRIKADSTPETIETWDSIQHLNLALSLEEKFDLQLSPEEIEKMRNIGEIAKLIESKLQAAPN
jgi:acyl carrier protein